MFVEELNFGANKLTGLVPSELALLTNLRTYCLVAIKPETFSRGTPNPMPTLLFTDKMTFYNNDLTGTIPSEIGRLTNLGMYNLILSLVAVDFPTDSTSFWTLLSHHRGTMVLCQ